VVASSVVGWTFTEMFITALLFKYELAHELFTVESNTFLIIQSLAHYDFPIHHLHLMMLCRTEKRPYA